MMKKIPDPFKVGEGEFGAYSPSDQYTPPTDPLVLKNLGRWQGLKFGVLLDWQACTQWGIDSWPLCPEQWDWNERKDFINGTPEGSEPDHLKYKAAYEALANTFHPTRFDPDQWAELLDESGVRYALIMAKHHDGFCLWDTAQTSYKTTSPNCPFHRLPGADTVKALSDALRKRRIRVGLYFSKPDWHSPFFWNPKFPLFPPNCTQKHIGRNANYDPRQHPEHWKKFKDFTWAQVQELMRNYGEMDILWLDGAWVNPSCNAQGIDMNGLAALARKYQPSLLIVDRYIKGANENYITPEGEAEMPAHHCAYPWEACMPIGRHWNYFPQDAIKSTGTVVRYLCRATARGGNYLLGIGPDARGLFDPVVVTRMRGVGGWLKLYGEAIFDTAPLAPYEQGNCVFTAKPDGTRYAIVLANDDNAQLPAEVTLPERLLEGESRISLLPFDVTLSAEPAASGQMRVRLPAMACPKLPAGTAWVIKFAPDAQSVIPGSSDNSNIGCSAISISPDPPALR